LSRAKREEAKITAWENLQKAKAEAAIQKLEVNKEPLEEIFMYNNLLAQVIIQAIIAPTYTYIILSFILGFSLVFFISGC